MPTRIYNFTTLLIVLSNLYPQIRSILSIPLRVFGCATFTHIHDHKRTKLGSKAQKCMFLGYSPSKKGYNSYSIVTRKYYISMDVTFFEFVPCFSQNSPQGEERDDGNFLETTSQIPQIPISPIKESKPPMSNYTSPTNLLHFSIRHKVLTPLYN